MTIDEAIAQFKYDAKCNRVDLDLGYAQDNEQLAEWLEELKLLREEKTEFQILARDNYEIAYNKAIDDAMGKVAKAICIGCGYLEGTKCTYKGANCQVSKPMLEVVVKALEELKAGRENE